MSLISETYPMGWAFSRNPIMARIESPGPVTYTVYDMMGSRNLFEGMSDGDVTIDISEVAESAFASLPTAAVTGEILMDGAEGVPRLPIRLSVSDGTTTEQVYWTVFRGGTSTRNYRQLRASGSDFFTARLRNYNGNFFFTSRSEGWLIRLRETELPPLAFIYPGDRRLAVRECLTGKRWEPGTTLLTEGAPCLLDMAALRRHFMTRHGVLANLFDVETSGRRACRIAIEEAPLGMERSLVRFLNSYGQWDVMDMPGIPTVTAPQDQEAGLFQRWDTLAGGFVTARERATQQETVEVSTGPIDNDRMTLLRDLLASDHVYLSFDGEEWTKCIPQTDDLTFPIRMTSPQGALVRLQLCDSESNITAPLTKDGSEAPRIHSEEFRDEFN